MSNFHQGQPRYANQEERSLALNTLHQRVSTRSSDEWRRLMSEWFIDLMALHGVMMHTAHHPSNKTPEQIAAGQRDAEDCLRL